MTTSETGWFERNFRLHSKLAFSSDVQEALLRNPPNFVRRCDLALAGAREPVLLVPVDLPTPREDDWAYVSFGTTELCVKGFTGPPSLDWSAWPPSGKPLWWRSVAGAITPAWDVWGTVSGLLQFKEERCIPRRDAFGRFAIDSSPRWAQGIAARPLVNDAYALMAAAAKSLQAFRGGGTVAQWTSMDARLGLILTHDCDIVGGNDPWTQSVRLGRAALPGPRSALARMRSLRALVADGLRPGSRYLEDLRGIWRLEAERGLVSTCYILNGPRGFGRARSTFAQSSRVIAETPVGCEVGVHYNVGALAGPLLAAQVAEIERVLGSRVRRGRAHYLKFDPLSDFDAVEAHGISIDESVGWPYHRAYRVGLAGVFFPWNERTMAIRGIMAVPVNFMDHGLVSAESGPLPSFRKMTTHLRTVGGVVSLLYHPGLYRNPEYPEYAGLLELALEELSETHSVTGSALLELRREVLADGC